MDAITFMFLFLLLLLLLLLIIIFEEVGFEPFKVFGHLLEERHDGRMSGRGSR